MGDVKIPYEIRYGHKRFRKANGSWRRDARRLEAEKRQKIYDALTTEEKITLVKSRPGNSTRELAKLENMLT